jgi:hypothetical protein
MIKVSEIEDEFLKQGWEGEDVVESYAESVDNGWTALQIWGFADVEGVRRHVRRVVTKKGKDELKIRIVYDWAPPS